MRVAHTGAALGLTLVVLHAPVLPPATAVLGLLALGLISGVLCAATGICRLRSMISVGAVIAPPLIASYHAVTWEERLLPEACERTPVFMEGRVNGLSMPGLLGSERVDLTVRSIKPARCAGPTKVRVYLASGFEARTGGGTEAGIESEIAAGAGVGVGTGASAGSESGTEANALPGFDNTELISGRDVIVEARLRRPWGTVNPKALIGERSYLVQGIHAVGSGTLLNSSESSEPALVDQIDRYRASISAWIRERVPQAPGHLLAALAVGDDRYLSNESWERLRSFGITHLVVISGLHISLVALFGWWTGAFLAAATGVRGWFARRAVPLAALLVAFAYALLAGLSLPTLRALLMLCLVMLPHALGRPAWAPRSFLATVWLLVALQPLAILSPGFWLSVSAVGCLLWQSVWRQGTGRRSVRGKRRAWRDVLPAQFYIVVAIAPMSLFWFGTTASVGAVANFLAIPFISFIIVPPLLLCISLRELCPWIAEGLLFEVGDLLSAGWSALTFVEPYLPGFNGLYRSLSLPVAAGAICAVLLLLTPRWPGRYSGLLLLVAPVLLHAGSDPDGMEVTVYDVGQGTAVLVRAGGDTLLYDTGPGVPGSIPVAQRSVLPHLASLGRTVIDHLIISHPDFDHIAGEPLIRQHFAVGNTWRGGLARPRYDEACRIGRRGQLGGTVDFMFLSGSAGARVDNDASCVLSLRYAGRHFLLPGDIHRDRERDLVAYWGTRLKADVLLAGHHGSNTSSSRLWLRTVTPAQLLMTSGRSNRFGHPALPVLQRAGELDIDVLNTAFSGALVYRVASDGSVSCHRLRHRFAPFWRQGTYSRNCGPLPVRQPGIILRTRSGDS